MFPKLTSESMLEQHSSIEAYEFSGLHNSAGVGCFTWDLQKHGRFWRVYREVFTTCLRGSTRLRAKP